MEIGYIYIYVYIYIYTHVLEEKTFRNVKNDLGLH